MDSRQTEPKNPTVREIVGAWLTAHGYSGLYWDDCGCAVDAVGGISYLRQSADVVADRARFLQAYEAMRTREQEHARMLPEVRQVVQRLGPAPALVEAGE